MFSIQQINGPEKLLLYPYLGIFHSPKTCLIIHLIISFRSVRYKHSKCRCFETELIEFHTILIWCEWFVELKAD
jgi:hypothetical protein